MVSANSLLYFLLSAGLSGKPEKSQDVQHFEPLNGIAAADWCPSNEEYSPCWAHCEDVCQGRKWLCNRYCVSGCMCKSGFARGRKGTCIKVEDCEPKERILDKVCPENERFAWTMASCQRNCTYWGRRCPREFAVGCVCTGNLVRGIDGKCIPWSQCPPRTLLTGEEESEEDSTKIYEEEKDTTIFDEEPKSAQGEEDSM